MEYFNITPNIAGFALGISTAMEEENAKIQSLMIQLSIQ